MLQNLPAEVIEATCHLLDARSISSFTQVSCRYHRIIQQSSALQYNIRLERAGLRDVQSPTSRHESATRLKMLTAYQAAWANFDCQSAAVTIEMEGSYWELVGNVIGTCSSGRFSFYRIPSPLRNVPPAQWSITDLPVEVNDFSMDLSQDLLLVVDISSQALVIHLLSLQTGRPHSLARSPRLSRDVVESTAYSHHNFQIRIFGEYVGIMADLDDENTEYSELQIWNWKTGDLKKYLYGDEFTSFAFMDNRRVLISACSKRVFVPENHLEPELRVIEIDVPRSVLDGYFSLQLPAIARQNMADLTMLIQTEPSPSWPADSNFEEPFATCHADRLFVVSLQGWDAFQVNKPTPTFMLCFRLSTVLNLMASPPGNRTVAWERWGPPNTRMLKVPTIPDPWVCFVYGQRCTIQMNHMQWRILDFNPLSTFERRIVHEVTVDKRRRLFTHPVSTWAPIALQSLKIPPCAAVMLAEDGIVVVSPDEDSLSVFTV
ncbi:hypothetical protein GGX14DRAFT_414427 [Mycena pura]|uniref:F-box domain-containing protein n=1 Tax=Mycena pura TaxID=153505 RepID=A0AAD6YTG9_9AGAR|nr:hypothetical protein GGX14DRAFT_414427 [Mycena pura]